TTGQAVARPRFTPRVEVVAIASLGVTPPAPRAPASRVPTSSAGSDVPSDDGGDRAVCMAENDWTAALEATGHGVIRRLLSARECAAISALYDQPERFRSKVVMAKHGYARREYHFVGTPLREGVLELRRSLYPKLVPVANRWEEAPRKPDRFPERLE